MYITPKQQQWKRVCGKFTGSDGRVLSPWYPTQKVCCGTYQPQVQYWWMFTLTMCKNTEIARLWFTLPVIYSASKDGPAPNPVQPCYRCRLTNQYVPSKILTHHLLEVPVYFARNSRLVRLLTISQNLQIRALVLSCLLTNQKLHNI